MTTEYRLSYTADEIDNKLGKIDNLVSSVNGVVPDEDGNVEIVISGNDSEIFIATYDKTTNAEIQAAIDAGKSCFVKRGDTILPMALVVSNTRVTFSGAYMDNLLRCDCVSNKWMSTIVTRSNSISEASTNDEYATAKAVWDLMSELDNNNIFVAVYGQTTNAEIMEAYEAGNILFARQGNALFPCNAALLASSARFGGTVSGSLVQIYCQDNVWSRETIGRTQTISSESTHEQYPTAKAVYDYVSEYAGGPGGDEVLCVSIESNEFDGYTTDTAASEIYNAFEAGKFVYCIINISEIDVLLPLIASGNRISVFSASTAMGAFEVKIVENIVEEVNVKTLLTEDNLREYEEWAENLIDDKLSGFNGGSSNNIELDTTLTKSGKAADAKAVGDALANYITETKLNEKGYLSSIPSEYVTESELNAKGYLTGYTETDPTVPTWAKASSKPTYTKSEVGLGNVDNVKQYSVDNPPPYPVTSVNNKTGIVTLTAADVGARPSNWVPTASEIGIDVSGVANNVISSHNSNTSAHSDIRSQIDQIASATGMDLIPSYWQNTLNNGVAAINTAVEAAGRNKSAFLWYTDAHWGYGSGMSPKLLKYLQDHTAVNKVNYGGDFGNHNKLPNGEYTTDECFELMRDFRYAVRNIKNHHSVIGNHDYNGSNGKVNYFNYFQNSDAPKHLYGLVMAPEETFDVVRGGDFYYYIDDKNEKTRYLYLDTNFCYDENYKFEVGQGAFVADALSSTPAGWHIVAISHIWFMYDPKNQGVENGYLPAYCGSLLDLFDKYNSRKSGSITIGAEDVSYDFSNKEGKVEFCIGGHLHIDHDFTSTGGIPVILTETDSAHIRSSFSYTAGTTSEASINGIVADYENEKVSVIRIGRGNSRVVALNGIVIPDDGDDPDIGGGDDNSGANSDDNILKTVGYKKDTRISASSAFSEVSDDNAKGTYLTGYIPVNCEDVLWFKNITMQQTVDNKYKNHIYCFDENKSGIASGQITDLIGTGYWRAEWDSNGNITKLVYGQKTGFVRINAAYIDDNSIVTKNPDII